MENKIHLGDNLKIMENMASDSIDLIVTDPPYATGKNFGAYDDRWKDPRNREYNTIHAYRPGLCNYIQWVGENMNESLSNFLVFMGIRLMEMRRVLKPTGSIYLQCDPSANSYIRLLLDYVFENLRNEIVWCYTGPGTNKMKQFSRKHDTIYWYSKSDSKWTFNPSEVRIPYRNGAPAKSGWGMTQEEQDIYSQRGKTPETWWIDIPVVSRHRDQITGYPTQKPLKLLRRIIMASSNEGDVIMDPFMGSGTTIQAAMELSRTAIGIDINPDTIDIVNKRIEQQNLF